MGWRNWAAGSVGLCRGGQAGGPGMWPLGERGGQTRERGEPWIQGLVPRLCGPNSSCVRRSKEHLEKACASPGARA